MVVHRIEVRARPGHESHKSERAAREAAATGLANPARIEQADVYLIEGDLDENAIRRICEELLTDPVTQSATIGAAPVSADACIEVQPLPGVMDPAAQAVKLAIRSILGVETKVQTGRRYDLYDVNQATARRIAERSFANTVIHSIHDRPFTPRELPKGQPREHGVVEIPIRDVDDQSLLKISRERHLFLSLEEMRAIQAEYRRLGREPREIELETLAQTWSEHCVHKTMKSTIRYREIEGERDFGDQSPRIAIRGLSRESMTNRAGHTVNEDGSVTIHNLLKSTVAAATHELIDEGIDWCLSVFVDNSGVIAFDDDRAVCFKCETHNHPSAIEPYGGAATGIGGCIRDIIGTGLAAKPIAATDIFCVAHPDRWQFNKESTEKDAEQKHQAQVAESGAMNRLPAGCLHPRRVLSQVVAGVRDYGNRMGIPTLNGCVWFDDRYVGNPLVFCGCIGVMPRDKIKGEPKRGDRIIAIGGRTGRDGIHGATFSSAELSETHADEFAHAVQIGNPVTQKMLLDAILEARDWYHHSPSGEGPAKPHSESGATARSRSEIGGTPLFNAITDCGAGGFSSAVGEMGRTLGAMMRLEQAPLKYEGLSPTEIWISEAQERMILAVPEENVPDLAAICKKHGVEMSDLGEFGTENGELILTYAGEEVGRLSMSFLHDGLPQIEREAVWEPGRHEGTEVRQRRDPPGRTRRRKGSGPAADEALVALLAHPNIASKHWIVRQYDHEVQGNTVIKPLVGPRGIGPGNGAVIVPPTTGGDSHDPSAPDATRGLAIANGLATGFSDDPYIMALMAIDECVRNLVCVGADPDRIAILDNFCWPSCDKPENLGTLVRAAEGCYDGAKAYRTPFISGKDSLNNQFTTEDGRTIEIPPTLLISGFGIVPDVNRCVTMDAKRAGNLLILIGLTQPTLRGSHYEMMFGSSGDALPKVDLELGPRTARAVHELIRHELVVSAHDVSDGGVLVSVAEMCIAGELGAVLDLESMPVTESCDLIRRAFAEGAGRYLVEVNPENLDEVHDRLGSIPHAVIGSFDATNQLRLRGPGENTLSLNVPIDRLRKSWRSTLDW